MFITRLHLRTASTRGGFTLVELLVVIGIIAILAGVALGPITNGIKQAKHNAAMQQARQIGQVCFSYSTDNTANGNLYPADSTGLTIAQDLMNANYVTDPGMFAITSQTGYTAPTTSGSGGLTTTNVSWSFTVVSTNTSGGVSSSTGDLTPLVFFDNGWGTAVTSAVKGTGANVAVTYGSSAPFGTDGAAIFYKGNNALYVKAGFTGTPGLISNFIALTDTDSTSYQVAP